MPHLPQIVQDQPLQGSGLSIGSAMAPGDAAARVGQDAANIGAEMTQRIIDVQRAHQIMTKSAQGAEAAAKAYDQIKNDPTVPNDQLAQRVQDTFKVLHDNIGADIKDRQVREIYDQNFQALTTEHIVNAVAEGRKRIISSANAGRDEANDTNINLAVNYPGGPIHDKAIADLMANTDSAVANRLITAEQGRREKSINLDKVEIGGVKKRIREDPSGVFADLQDPEKYKNIDAVMKQDLTTEAWNMVQANAQQALTNEREKNAEEEKNRSEAIGADVTNLRLLASENKLTHQDVADAVHKWIPTKPGQKSFPGPEISVLTDMINKPPEFPSEKGLYDSLQADVASAHPVTTKVMLANMRNTNRLNRTDFQDLDNKLTTNLHYAEDKSLTAVRQRQAQSEMVLRSELGADPSILGNAIKDMAEGSAAMGGKSDPFTLLPQILDKYKPQMVSLGGLSKATALGQFNTARNAYKANLELETKWAGGIKGTIADTFEDNPYTSLRIMTQADLLNKAKAVGMDGGPAKKGAKEGQTIYGADHKFYIVVGGRMIPE